MKKIRLIAVVAMFTASAFADSAPAQSRDRARDDRGALTVSQIVAQEDARTARIKADLRLTAEQEKNWPGLETALRDIGKTRAERRVALRADREARKEPADVIEHLNRRAKTLGDRSADVKKLADAAQPLYASLDEQQKKRFADELIRLTQGRDSEE
ncbi:MAG: Spy/CpxP family protein refolding chaperone [Xanthobacteraceae bacterium]